MAIDIGSANLLVHLSKVLKMKGLCFMSKFQANVIAGLDYQVGLINLKLGEVSKGKHFYEKFKLLIEKIDYSI